MISNKFIDNAPMKNQCLQEGSKIAGNCSDSNFTLGRFLQNQRRLHEF